MKHTIERRTRLPFPARAVFDWHLRPGALERLTPPWQRVEVLQRTGTIRDGGRVTLRLWVANVPLTWVVEHRDFIDGLQFRDVQVKGPFKSWSHLHRFEPAGENACTMIDKVEFELRGGYFGDAAGEPFTREQLERMFNYRARLLPADMEEHRRIAQGRSLTVAVTGSTGLIGGALVPFLTTGGHTVKRITRPTSAIAGDILWSPAEGRLDPAALDGVDAVVHLAGESVFAQWTPERKQRIRDSRVVGTRLLAETLTKLDRKPSVFVSASAIGYYGSRGDETLTEESAKGEGFLAGVVAAWEAAAQPAADAGIRVVHPRIGVVLDPRGGALAKMLPVFRLGLGGPLAGGAHHVSWITLEDLVSILHRMLFDDALAGPVNAVAPDPVTNRELTAALGEVLSRPTVLPVPRKAAEALFGEELVRETMLLSQRIQPMRLLKADHRFRHPKLAPALRGVLGRSA